MTDTTDRIQSGRTGLEKLIARLPGFGGYMNKEDRRAADKLLRDTTARRLDEQRKRLADIQSQLLRDGQIDNLDEIETANRRLNTAIDKLRTASYGYAGLFDPIKIQEAELDRLYSYDLTIVDRLDHIEAAINTLDTTIRGGGTPAQPIPAPAPLGDAAGVVSAPVASLDQNLRDLNDLLRDLITAIDQRHDMLTSGQ